MKKILFFAFALLVITACKDDEKPEPSEFTNTYSYNGETTDISWRGFYYDDDNDAYYIGVCKETPEGELTGEDEFITFKVPAALLNSKINVTDDYEDYAFYFSATFGYEGMLYQAQEGTALLQGIISGNFTVTRSGTSNVFSMKFTLNLDDGGTVKGNYKGSFSEVENLCDVSVCL